MGEAELDKVVSVWPSRPTFTLLHPAWGAGVRQGLPGPLASSGFSHEEALVGDGVREGSGASSEPVLQTGHSPDQNHCSQGW